MYQKLLKDLYNILDEKETYKRSIEKLKFDMECIAPPEGINRASYDIAVLGKRLYELNHSDEYVELLKVLHSAKDALNDIDKILVERLYEDYQKEKNITPDFSYRLTLACNKAYEKWLDAKANSDYSVFKDSFAEVVSLQREALELRPNRKYPLYDNCLNDYERGGSSGQLDTMFGDLKEPIIMLLNRINASDKQIRKDFLHRKCAIENQEKLSHFILEKEGLRKTALVLMTTEHPFTTNFGPNDVRVTTHYYEEDFISNMFTILHEGGHALFMQNEPEIFYSKHIAGGVSQAMTECIARFYENIIGRSEAFIHFIYPVLQEVSGGVFEDITELELYEAVNAVQPSLIRMDADELTYCLHIIIRYEIEKALVNGEITVDEVPAIWKQKYKEYLRVDVPDDAQGCLQDVHWTSEFGYFPSYALGNAYGAQILCQMEKEFDVWDAVRNGKLDRILDWFKQRVFNCASVMTPDEWIVQITGEHLNIRYYIDYLKNKYEKIYKI